MKHLWQLLAVSGALVVAGCADSPTPVSPEAERVPAVPASILVPRIGDSTSGRLAASAHGAKRLITDDPVSGDDGSGTCDGCDPNAGGGSAGTSDGSLMFTDPVFTEVHFEGDKLIGHAEMSFILADHASQEMTLTTSRADGSTISSQKFSTARAWPLPVVFVQTLTTDGAIFAPACGARGLGSSTHDVSAILKAMFTSRRLTSVSPMMYQPACQTTQQREETTAGAGGTLRICLREDHYSSTGQFIYTETLYCYDVNAT